MCHLRHRQRIFFLFHRKVMFRSQDIQVSIFLTTMICQICDVMISIKTWDMVHFLIYLLNHNSLTHETWSIDRYKQGQLFSEIFCAVWRTRPKFQAFFNLATCSNYPITNYVKFPVCRVDKGELKMVNINF